MNHGDIIYSKTKGFEYACQCKYTTQVGVEEALKVTTPPGNRWALVTVNVEGTLVLYWWKRRRNTK